MPLKAGKSNATVKSNVEELHSGKTHARTQRKFGKARADAQSIAIALKKAGRSKKKRSSRTSKNFWG